MQIHNAKLLCVFFQTKLWVFVFQRTFSGGVDRVRRCWSSEVNSSYVETVELQKGFLQSCFWSPCAHSGASEVRGTKTWVWQEITEVGFQVTPQIFWKSIAWPEDLWDFFFHISVELTSWTWDFAESFMRHTRTWQTRPVMRGQDWTHRTVGDQLVIFFKLLTGRVWRHSWGLEITQSDGIFVICRRCLFVSHCSLECVPRQFEAKWEWAITVLDSSLMVQRAVSLKVNIWIYLVYLRVNTPIFKKLCRRSQRSKIWRRDPSAGCQASFYVTRVKRVDPLLLDSEYPLGLLLLEMVQIWGKGGDHWAHPGPVGVITSPSNHQSTLGSR